MSQPTPKEIRECFQDYRSDWDSIRNDAALDMRAISVEGPWTPEDRDARRQSGRPCIHLDQTNQFLNQTIGNVRKSKRAVKAIPKGNGANDKDAKNRSSLIMGIEERSQAQTIYLYAFECMIQRSYGFALLRTEYRDDSNFDQEILVKPVLNPEMILISPHYKQPDVSDIPDGFILDRITKEKFKRKYPKAEVTDFSGSVMGESGVSDWITDKYVQEGEYWKVESTYKKLLLVDGPAGPIVLSEDDYKKISDTGARKPEVKRTRQVEVPKVMQYMTNGVEILGDPIPWAGSRIPIISCFGPERWTSDGKKATRELLSMVRFARDPQMLFDYLATQECEFAGLVPKVPYVGYKGQFESDKDTWETITKVPHAFVQADIVVDGATNGTLPLPKREEFNAPFQEYEVAKDAAARALQGSMGITPLPDAAQRRNQKSGVALEKIDDMESLGSFHFVDRYENCFLHNMGWQINELITPILDTQRQMPIPNPDGTRKLIDVVGNTSHPMDEQGAYNVQGLQDDKGETSEHIHTGKGEFDVTISTGPSYASEREEQSAFVDQLLENMPNLPQPGTPSAKVLALAVRMRPDLGPIGEQIADVFDPPDPSNFPPAAQAAISQMQGQLQQLTQENTALHMDRAGRVLEQQTKKEIEQLKANNSVVLQHLKNLTDLIKAELAAKSRSTDQIAEQDASKLEAMLGFSHEAAAQTLEHHHENQLAEKQHEQAKELATQQGAQAMMQQEAAQNQPNQ